MEEAYKREAELFRNESLKREEEWEEERSKYEGRLQVMRTQNEQSVEFVGSLRKEFIKVLGNIQSKQRQFGQENQEQNIVVMGSMAEGMKRIVESINKRIDSFIYYSNSSYKSSIEQPGVQSRVFNSGSKENMGEMYQTLYSMTLDKDSFKK